MPSGPSFTSPYRALDGAPYHGDSDGTYAALVPDRVACETLDAMCSVCKVHCATWRTDVGGEIGYWTLDACDAFGQRWIVHHEDLLKVVVLLGEMLGVDWEDG